MNPTEDRTGVEFRYPVGLPGICHYESCGIVIAEDPAGAGGGVCGAVRNDRFVNDEQRKLAGRQSKSTDDPLELGIQDIDVHCAKSGKLVHWSGTATTLGSSHGKHRR